jgi:hypothetical protein
VGYNQCGCYFSHLPSCLAFSPASFGKWICFYQQLYRFVPRLGLEKASLSR